MKYCYKEVCITTSSVLFGVLLSLLFLIVYSNNRIILIEKTKKNKS